MGWLDWCWQLIAGSSNPPDSLADVDHPFKSVPAAGTAPGAEVHSRDRPKTPASPASGRKPGDKKRKRRKVKLFRTKWVSSNHHQPPIEVGKKPYTYSRIGSTSNRYLDLSQTGDDERLRSLELPILRTPDDIATWLKIPLKRLAWLTHRFTYGVATAVSGSHYHYQWIRKRSGGWRLIESPKTSLREAQHRILDEILGRIAPHAAAHGFVAGHSIVTHAQNHVGKQVVVKFDLSNFYASVGRARIVAIFRSFGYSREAAIWLAELTTTMLPANTPFPEKDPYAIHPFLRRHLPQGAPTSPALANLSAYTLDLRLAGLAGKFGATYTRYADDLTFSGDEQFATSLGVFIPLVQQIARRERFTTNKQKRRVMRQSRCQRVTGVVVNRHCNYPRQEYDRLKAILTNCIRLGPSTQNLGNHENFQQHLLGRVAFVMQLNSARGKKLKTLLARIDWKR